MQSTLIVVSIIKITQLQMNQSQLISEIDELEFTKTQSELNLELNTNKESTYRNASSNFKGNDQALIEPVNSIIMNSLKKNQLIQEEINAKEYSIMTETQMHSSKMTSFSRQIAQFYKKTQQLYEDTIKQNQKARYLAENFIQPMKDQLKGKVDQTTFTLKMKMMLTQYDSLGDKISYENGGKKAMSNVSFDFLRDQMIPIIGHLQSEITNCKLKQKENNEILSSLNAKSKQMDLEQGQKDRERELNQKKMIQQVMKRNNESLIDAKIKKFKEEYVSQNFKTIVNSIKDNHLQLNKEVKKIGDNTQIITIKEDIQNVKINLEKIQKNISENIVNEIKQSQLKIENIIQKDERVIKINKQIEVFKQKLDRVSQKVKNEIMEDVGKGVVGKVNSTDLQMKNMKVEMKNIRKQFQIVINQLSSVRQILSKKANYSDFIQHFDRKADKNDYQELKSMIKETSQEIMKKKQKRSPNNVEEDVQFQFSNTKRSKKNSQFVMSKRYLTPSPASPIYSDSYDKDDFHKKFGLGIEKEFKTRSKIQLNQTDINFFRNSKKISKFVNKN